MKRGSTPTHTFHISCDTSLIKEVKITYAQGNDIVLTKKAIDCELRAGKIVTKLTQEDSFKFDCTKPVYIQLRVLFLDGECVPSDIKMVDVGRCLDDEVLI